MSKEMMTLQEAMEARHSVRKYTKEPIRAAHVEELNAFIADLNAKSGLHMQLITEQEEAFKTLMNHYGWLRNVRNYVALVGPDKEDLDELCGYYGEMVVLRAQQLGLGTCWVGGTFNRKKTDYEAAAGEKLRLVIAIGYPEKDGKMHRNKPVTKLSNLTETSPQWFKDGMAAVLLAPTAVNQQKFRFELLENGKVKAIANGSYGKVDLGITKYHFELGAGKDGSIWD